MLDILANVSVIDFGSEAGYRLWDAQSDLNKASVRIGYNAMVVAKFADAQEQIRQLTQPRSPLVEALRFEN